MWYLIVKPFTKKIKFQKVWRLCKPPICVDAALVSDFMDFITTNRRKWLPGCAGIENLGLSKMRIIHEGAEKM